MLFEYADCVGEGRCVCVGTQEPPFTNPLKTILGWEEAKWKVLVGLKYVLRSMRFVWENLSPLWMFRSRNCTCMSDAPREFDARVYLVEPV